jgi:DNA-binding MarR family transcriptional regulator
VPRSKPARHGPVSFLLAQIGAHAAARFAERLAVVGLEPQHAGILRVLGGTAGLSQQELAGVLKIHPSRLVAIVDDLEGRGLVARRENPNDRRTYALHLTDRGQSTLAEVGRVALEHNDAICQPLDPAERDQLLALLGKIADGQGLTPGVHPGYGRLGRKGPPTR